MNNYVPVDYQNPDATMGLKLALQLISNTPDEEIERNIRSNSKEYTNWLQAQDAHSQPAVMIGGGDSINDHIEEIKTLQQAGAAVFGLNASSKWARKHGIEPDYQVIIDAKEETSTLVDTQTNIHLFASRCNPVTMEQANDLHLFHLETGDVESLLPEERVSRGGYVLVGGDATVGTCALCVAFTQGYREFHVFGYDSSHREGKSHAYKQIMNNNMPTMEIEQGGKKYISSIAMSRQPASFLTYTKALKNEGCSFHVYGEGLLQAIYNTKIEDLSEREKYQLMWQIDDYRNISPGEQTVDFFLGRFKPDGLIIDYGCGTGRAGIVFSEAGHDVMLVDFANNCRDEEALKLPFLKHDITEPCPLSSKYGYCTDVMEHLPPEDVRYAILNIMNSSEEVFFQISTTEDHFGKIFDTHLHLTVKPHSWWKDTFISHGYEIQWEMEQEQAALFYVINPDRRKACQ